MKVYDGYPESFTKASKLVSQEPLPSEILEQLRELRDDTPREFWPQFKMFFESAMNRMPDG